MSNLRHRIIALQKGYAELQQTIYDKNNPHCRPTAVLFSFKMHDLEAPERYATQFRNQVLYFTTKLKNERDQALKAALSELGVLAYRKLHVIMPELLPTDSRYLTMNEMLYSLENLVSERNKEAVNAKFREFDQMQLELQDKRNKQLANPELTHEIIEHRHQQMRYDQMGQVGSYLMGTYLKQLFENAGDIPELPINRKRSPNASADDAAAAFRAVRPVAAAGA